MDEIKTMLESLVQGCLKARNAEDEKTDKRKLIDEVGGILKDKVDEEVWRTVIGKLEKLAYEKSEAGTADNKAKNEDEKKEEIKEEKKEEKKEDKEEDKKAENEEDDEEKEGECLYSEFKKKIEKEAENGCKKAKNSIDEFKKEFFSGKVEKTTSYMSQAAGIELGKKLY